jgi:hypothetical protein
MTDAYTSDETICAAAQNLCATERQAGREAVFLPSAVGLGTWRQARLYEFALIAQLTDGLPHQAAVHAEAVKAMDRYRSR